MSRRHMRCGHDRGSVSLLIVVLIPAVLIGAGLVLDGGRQLEARRDANGTAQAAARAAVQMTPPEVYAQRLDTTLASHRARVVLSTRGYSGSVSFDGDGTVTVTAGGSVDYLILPGGASVTGTATADPQIGVNESES